MTQFRIVLTINFTDALDIVTAATNVKQALQATYRSVSVESIERTHE